MSDSDQPDTSEQASPSPGRRIFTWLLWGCLLVSLIFAAWQGSIFISRRAAVATDTQPGRVSPGRADLKKIDAPNVSELLRNPAAAAATANLKPVVAAPPVAPPDGASEIWALGRKDRQRGRVELQWAYYTARARQDIAAYYRAKIIAAGYRQLPQPPPQDKQGRMRLLFRKGEDIVYLSVQSATGKNRVVLTQTRPSRKGDFKSAETLQNCNKP